MGSSTEYNIYKTVIQQVMEEQEQLPSLPAITWQIRSALADENTTTAKLSSIISKDPGFSALLMKCASSPMYRQENSPSTLEGVIAMLGLSAVDNLVMAHSVKSLFVMRSPLLKKLFRQTWQRLLLKAGVGGFLATKLGYRPAEQAIIATLLSEVGTLAVLSAFKDREDIPHESVFHQLCREYSKSLGTILLNKWQVDKVYIDIIRWCGQWDKKVPGELQLIDLVNLALYSAIQLLNPKNNLPDIELIKSYEKLPAPFNVVDNSHHQLLLIKEHLQEVTRLSFALR